MLNFFRAGNRAARNQLLAAMTVSVVAIVATRNTWLIGVSSSPDGAQAAMNIAGQWFTTYRLVAWSDVILAAGFSLTCTGGLDDTVENMKRASRQMSSRQPRRPLKILASLLSLSAVLAGVLALQPPPPWLAQSHPVDVTGFAVACIWPGLISTAVAYFGSNAKAAIRALD